MMESMIIWTSVIIYWPRVLFELLLRNHWLTCRIWKMKRCQQKQLWFIWVLLWLSFWLCWALSSVQLSESKRPKAQNFKNWRKANVLQITDLPEKHFKKIKINIPTISSYFNNISINLLQKSSKFSKQIYQKFCYDQLFFLKRKLLKIINLIKWHNQKLLQYYYYM